MEFRDIVYHDSNSVPETTTGHQEDDFQKIISYIGTDFMKRFVEMNLYSFLIHYLTGN